VGPFQRSGSLETSASPTNRPGPYRQKFSNAHNSSVSTSHFLQFGRRSKFAQLSSPSIQSSQRSTSPSILTAMIPIGSHPAWHPVLETLAYASGFGVFRWLRGRHGDVVAEPQRWTVLAAAAVGALIGSRLLGIAEQWPTVIEALRSGRLWELLLSPGGKTIVGGLLGGWLGVLAAKKLSGIRRRTGDLFVLPLCVGIAVGRVGCLLAGLADDTYGKPTTLPWAVNLGDGVGRHPVQLYEILFLILLGVILTRKVELPDGARFRIFIASYLGWRIVIDFWKPQPLIGGMNVIQWSCLMGILCLVLDFVLGRKVRNVRAIG